MGVTGIPHCFNGIFCDYLNEAVSYFVYDKLPQNFLAPASYYRDPKHMTEYLF